MTYDVYTNAETEKSIPFVTRTQTSPSFIVTVYATLSSENYRPIVLLLEWNFM